jgi:hypothetical protein
MKALRRLLIASLSVVVLATGAAHAASTTNFSDQWMVTSESGWGVSVQQQSNTLFIDLMVYGTDGKPTWFVATASLQTNPPQGHTVFVGDLYATAGPYYGVAFNPALVTSRKVGTLTFDATSGSNATMSYTVDGTPVVKNVTRQTWSQEDLAGIYDAFWMNNCGSGPLDWEPALLTVVHDANNQVVITLSCPYCFTNFNHALRGNYVQLGHQGQVTADLLAPDTGSITIYEIEKTTAGFIGRLHGTITSSGQTCEVTNGSVGAVRQP